MREKKMTHGDRPSIEPELYEKMIRQRSVVKIFLANGFQLRGILEDYDNKGLLFDMTDGGKKIFIYKSFISTLEQDEITLYGNSSYVDRSIGKGNKLEETVYQRAIDGMIPITIFHVNGYKSFVVPYMQDKKVIYARRYQDGKTMYIYKSAISSVEFRQNF